MRPSLALRQECSFRPSTCLQSCDGLGRLAPRSYGSRSMARQRHVCRVSRCASRRSLAFRFSDSVL
eukprot:3935204-Prymnesium_polylepis.1